MVLGGRLDIPIAKTPGGCSGRMFQLEAQNSSDTGSLAASCISKGDNGEVWPCGRCEELLIHILAVSHYLGLRVPKD